LGRTVRGTNHPGTNRPGTNRPGTKRPYPLAMGLGVTTPKLWDGEVVGSP